MNLSQSLVRRRDGLQSRLHLFIVVIALMGSLLIGASTVAWKVAGEQRKLGAAYTQTLGVLRSANAIKIASLDIIRGERGYLLTGEDDYLEPYRRGRHNLRVAMGLLNGQAHFADPGSVVAFRHLQGEIDNYTGRLEQIIQLASKGDGAAAIRLVKRNESRLAIARIDRAVDRIIQSERDRLHQISREVDRSTQELLTFIYVISFAGLCLLILAGLIAIALYRSFERERHYREELKYRAETDELTGVANRRQLLASLDRAIAAARLNKTPLSFALVDIDNFKQVNDTHGHAAGDEVIRHVVQAGLATVRGYDTLGRLGGEEFGIILPKTSELNAYAVGERLRDQIHNLIVEIDDGVQISVTISTGIACLTAEDDAALLMERADRALYQAKRSGRDQVKLAA